MLLGKISLNNDGCVIVISRLNFMGCSHVIMSAIVLSLSQPLKKTGPQDGGFESKLIFVVVEGSRG